jgi:hypothetical protein
VDAATLATQFSPLAQLRLEPSLGLGVHHMHQPNSTLRPEQIEKLVGLKIVSARNQQDAERICRGWSSRCAQTSHKQQQSRELSYGSHKAAAAREPGVGPIRFYPGVRGAHVVTLNPRYRAVERSLRHHRTA